MKDLRKYLTLHMLLTARSVIECAVIVHALVGMGGGEGGTGLLLSSSRCRGRVLLHEYLGDGNVSYKS